MKFLLTLSSILILSVSTAAQVNKTITISGKTFRPVDTLVLLKPFEDIRYNGLKIPVAADSTFRATFTVDCVEEYELIFLSEFKNGGWRSVAFFTDAKRITFELYDMQRSDSSKVYGSPLTDQKAAFNDKLMERWHPEFLKFEEKAKSGASPSALKTLEDSLVVAMTVWRQETSENYPPEIALSNYYETLTNYQENERLKPILKNHHNYWLEQPRINATSDVIADLYFAKVEKLTGKPFPDFHLLDGTGDSTLLSQELSEDGFLLLDLWSPWCGPCIKKSKTALENLDKLQANDVKVIGVMGGIDTSEKFTSGKSRFTYPWPVYPEVQNHQKIWQRYGFSYSGGGQVLIDGQGIILAINPSVDDMLVLTKQ